MLFQPNNSHQSNVLQTHNPMLSGNLQAFQDNFNSSNFNLNRNNNTNNNVTSSNNNEMNSMPNFINNQFKSIQQQLSINNQSQHQQQPHSLNHSPNKLEAFSTQGSIVPPMFTKPSALSFINSGNENNQIENQRIHSMDNRKSKEE